MKTTFIFSICICSLFLFINNSDVLAENENPKPLETYKDKLSYIIGTNMAKSIMNFKEEIELDILIEGMKDQFYKNALRVSGEEAEAVMRPPTPLQECGHRFGFRSAPPRLELRAERQEN
ncbi:MAG: FKBP-type peptidyl-prolyl cis-trans isomerase N-terminal domain-containing protein, partial [Desulfobacterales bacterium]